MEPIVPGLNSRQSWQSSEMHCAGFHGELTGEKHISSYQSNRKWRVSSGTPNQDRSCSEMCLGIVPISLFPSRFFPGSPVPGGGGRGDERGRRISLYDGSQSRRLHRWAGKSGPRFRHLSPRAGFNTAEMSCS